MNTVILLYSSNRSVRGKLKRYLYEVKPNVFVGTISERVRQLLWAELQKTKTKADLIVHTNSEQGFLFDTTMDKYSFEDFQGVRLPIRYDRREKQTTTDEGD